jgi:CBS domain-containing protein
MKSEPTTREMLAGEGVPEPTELLEVAVEHATYRVPIAAPGQTAGSVRKGLLGGQLEAADDVAVLDDRRLVGLVPIERLLTAPDQVAIEEIMDADPPVVSHGVDQEQVAWKMIERGESSVAVVDDRDRFVRRAGCCRCSCTSTTRTLRAWAAT